MKFGKSKVNHMMSNVVQGSYGDNDEQAVAMSSCDDGKGLASNKIKLSKNNIYCYGQIYREQMLQFRMNTETLIDQLYSISVDFRGSLPLSLMSINIHLCTLGGDTYQGLAIYDYLQYIKKEYGITINIYVQGYSCSAGTMIMMAGDNRYITPNSFIMVHQMSTIFSGKYQDLKDQKILCDKLMDKIYKIYSDATNIGDLEIRQLIKKDLWLTAQQALQLNFITKII